MIECCGVPGENTGLPWDYGTLWVVIRGNTNTEDLWLSCSSTRSSISLPIVQLQFRRAGTHFSDAHCPNYRAYSCS